MKTAITPTRAENFSEWYQNLIVAADLAESAPVRGCMTIKPYGWAIWELMRDEMDRRIKAHGVQNANFPLLIPIEFFNKEENKNICNAFRSSLLTVEIVAKDVDKGKATMRLAEILGIDKENVGAIGDYYNDLPMLKIVAHPVCCGQAPDDIKNICEYVTCHCNDGAVSDFINYIEKFSISRYYPYFLEFFYIFYL